MQTSSISSLSVAGTPARERHSRSHLRAPGLADRIRHVLRLELRRGRDRRSRFSSRSRSRSSSGGSSDSESSNRSERSQASVSHCCFSRSSRSSSRSRRTRSSRSDRYRRSPRSHGHRFHSYRSSDCSRSRSPRRRSRPRDSAVSCSPLPFLAAHRTSSALVRCRALCAPSLWPLGLSRPLRSPPQFSRLLHLPRLLGGMLRGSLSL